MATGFERSKPSQDGVQNRFESLKLKTRRHAALVRLMFDFLSPLSETEPRVASCHCTHSLLSLARSHDASMSRSADFESAVVS